MRNSKFEIRNSKLDEPDGLTLLEMIVAGLLGALLGWATGRASGDDYLAARVAAAVALARSGHATESHPAPNRTESTPDAAERPVVFLYVAPFHCPPCEAAKRDIKAWKNSPMRFVVDKSPTIQVDSYPTLHWNDSNGKGKIITGWPGIQSFEATWRATMEAGKKAVEGSDRLGSLSPQAPQPRNRYPPMAGYRPGWTWPGDLRQHLLSTHGVSEAGELTQDQAEALHDALHEGHSLEAIRRRLSR